MDWHTLLYWYAVGMFIGLVALPITYGIHQARKGESGHDTNHHCRYGRVARGDPGHGR